VEPFSGLPLARPCRNYDADALKEIQIPRKEIQSFSEGNPRKSGRKSKDLSSADRAMSITYADPAAFFIFCADAGVKRRRNLGVARSPLARRRSFRLRFRFLRSRASEGLAPFQDRGRSGALRPTLAAAEPLEREKGTPASTDPRARARKPRTGDEDRPIDPMSGRNSSA
jgi:hypothetical protein